MVQNNVTVIFRERPFVPEGNEYIILHHNPGELILDDDRPRFKKRPRNIVFQYKPPAVYLNYQITNIRMFQNSIKLLVDSFITDNTNGIAYMAYGQTGSGKTHTLVGSTGEMGLIQNTLKYYLDTKLIRKHYTINLQCLEIYNERIYDLLNQRQEVIVREANNQLHFGVQPKQSSIYDFSGLVKYMGIISRNKIMGETKVNQTSSRSHTIYRFTLLPVVGGKSKTLLYLDLAGTERGRFSLANDRIAIKEYTSINQSLFALKECIRAIHTKQRHIPYRRSKLTMLLKDIFYNQYRLHFIANLNPSSLYFHDVLDTLRYATSLANSNIEELQRELVKKLPPVVATPPQKRVIQKHPPKLTPHPPKLTPHPPKLTPHPPSNPRGRPRHPVSSIRKLVSTEKTRRGLHSPVIPNVTQRSPIDTMGKKTPEHVLIKNAYPTPETSDTAVNNVSLHINRVGPRMTWLKDPDKFPPILKYYYYYIIDLHKINRRDHRNYGKVSKHIRERRVIDMRKVVNDIENILDHRIAFLVGAKHKFQELLVPSKS